MCQGEHICSKVHEALSDGLELEGGHEISGVLSMGWVAPKHETGKLPLRYGVPNFAINRFQTSIAGLTER